MKHTANYLLAMIILVTTACNNEHPTDPKKIADKQNEQKETAGTLSKSTDEDSKYVADVSGGVLMEVELGSYAQKFGASDEVKQFGAQMVADHSKDREALETMAAKKNISIPDRPGDDYQKHIDELEKFKGAEFDKKYISFMVSDHHDDIDEFKKEAENGKDPEIVAFANKGIPILQMHLEMAKAINEKLK